MDVMNTALRTTASAHACPGILVLMVFVDVSTLRKHAQAIFGFF